VFNDGTTCEEKGVEGARVMGDQNYGQNNTRWKKAGRRSLGWRKGRVSPPAVPFGGLAPEQGN